MPIEHGNLLEVVKSEDDLGCLLHANEIIQYRDGISVPHKKNTVSYSGNNFHPCLI